jgi:guanylate kinase
VDLQPVLARGFILAVSAPSGTGKTSLCDKLAQEDRDVMRSVSVTTRKQRDGEVSGRDYTFVSVEEFKRLEEKNQLLETAQVFGNWYGTPKTPVLEALSKGQVIVMDIDTVGALKIAKLYPQDTVLVYVYPPSLEDLEKRLIARGKNSPEDLAMRLKEAASEIKESRKYHYGIRNLDFDKAYSELKAVVAAERLKLDRMTLPF